MVVGPRGAAGRRRASDAAVSRARPANALELENAMILTRCLTAESTPEKAVALYQQTRGLRVKGATEQAARRGDRYRGEPNADSLKGDEPGAQYAYDAVAGTLGR
jgi:hypothetical protein